MSRFLFPVQFVSVSDMEHRRSVSVVSNSTASSAMSESESTTSHRRANGKGKTLMTLTQDAEVYLWDIGTRRCISRWKDEGNFGASVLNGSRNGAYHAIGYVKHSLPSSLVR